ncbi:MAG: hypothetical protein WAZ97_15980, partial [Pseudolabrys sp.]
DRADYVGDVLYLPEVLYLVMLVVVVLAGPGPLRLDSVVLGALADIPSCTAHVRYWGKSGHC